MSVITTSKVDVNFRVESTRHAVELRLDYLNSSMFLTSWKGIKGEKYPSINLEIIKQSLIYYVPNEKIDILAYEIYRLLPTIEPYWDND